MQTCPAPLPTAAYGAVMLLAAIAYIVLQATIIRHQGAHSRLGAAVRGDMKGKLSAAMYAAAIPLAFVHERISDALYVAVALIWLVPDPRIEARIAAER